jgi:hypothetical protein
MPGLSDFAKRWEAWGIPAAIGVLAPWYEKVIAFPLISPYWQPGLNTVCTVLGALAAVAAFALCHGHPKKVVKGWLYRSLVFLVAAFLACLVLKLTVGVAFFPGAHYQWIVWAAWIIAYVATFAYLGATLVLAMLLLPTPPGMTGP